MRQLILILFLIYVCASDLKITTVEMADLQLNIFCREISTMLLYNIEDVTSSNTSPIIILSFHRKIQEPRHEESFLRPLLSKTVTPESWIHTSTHSNFTSLPPLFYLEQTPFKFNPKARHKRYLGRNKSLRRLKALLGLFLKVIVLIVPRLSARIQIFTTEITYSQFNITRE